MVTPLPLIPKDLLEERREAYFQSCGPDRRVELERKEKSKSRKIAWGFIGGFSFLMISIFLMAGGLWYGVGFLLCVYLLVLIHI